MLCMLFLGLVSHESPVSTAEHVPSECDDEPKEEE